MKTQKFNVLVPYRNRVTKFILIIGDEGAVLTLIKQGKLESRLFATLNSPEDIDKFKVLLASDPKTPISILIDVSDQTYSKQTLPGISSFTLNKLVQKKLSRDLAGVELKNSINLGKSKNGRNEWNIMFVGCPLVSPLKEWMDFATEQPNAIGDICMLPIEIASIISKLNHFNIDAKKDGPKNETNKASKWQLIVTHNKVGGFRQVAFHENKVIFTRLIAIQSDESAHYIAGNIEQELLNTIEYLKRLSLKENDGFDLVVIVSQDIKNSLQQVKFTARNILIMTPYEAAYKIGLRNTAVESDKYADIITSVNFAISKPILPFINESLRKIKFFEMLTKFSLFLFVLSLFSIAIFTGIMLFQMYDLNQQIKIKQIEYVELQEIYDKAKGKLGNLEEIDKISDVVGLYKILTHNNTSPFAIIRKFMDIKDPNLLVKSVNWKLKEALKSDPGADPKNDAPAQSSVNLNCEFYNENMGYQKLFDNFDRFITLIENEFKDYTIEYSRNTEKINFDNSIKRIPLQITITGPNLKVNKGN